MLQLPATAPSGAAWPVRRPALRRKARPAMRTSPSTPSRCGQGPAWPSPDTRMTSTPLRVASLRVASTAHVEKPGTGRIMRSSMPCSGFRIVARVLHPPVPGAAGDLAPRGPARGLPGFGGRPCPCRSSPIPLGPRRVAAASRSKRLAAVAERCGRGGGRRCARRRRPPVWAAGPAARPRGHAQVSPPRVDLRVV